MNECVIAEMVNFYPWVKVINIYPLTHGLKGKNLPLKSFNTTYPCCSTNISVDKEII